MVQDFHVRRADIVADPYTPDDAERLIAAPTDADPQSGQVARLQAGQRTVPVSEAVQVQARWIVG